MPNVNDQAGIDQFGEIVRPEKISMQDLEKAPELQVLEGGDFLTKYSTDAVGKKLVELDIRITPKVVVEFLELLPRGAVVIEGNVKDNAIGKNKIVIGNRKNLDEFIKSISRVMDSASSISMHSDANRDPENIIKLAKELFVTADVSKYIPKENIDHLLVYEDIIFSNKSNGAQDMLGMLGGAKKDGKAHLSFAPANLTSQLAGFCQELPDNINTMEKKEKYAAAVRAIAAGKIAALTKPFSQSPKAKQGAFFASNDEETKIPLKMLYEAAKEVQENPKLMDLSQEDLVIKGRESLVGKLPKTFIGKSIRQVKKILVGENGTRRSDIFKATKAGGKTVVKKKRSENATDSSRSSSRSSRSSRSSFDSVVPSSPSR